ncbi:MAG: DUF2863 family protein [Betaproteobacteria bacterium]|nr:DUF2863 family protein [Betaproteobacteria bacterium]
MKRQRSTSRGRMPRNSERLVALALHLKTSGSRLEDGFWERELDALLTKLLAAGNDEAVEAALDHLVTTDAAAYDLLMDRCESTAESQLATVAATGYDLLLLAAPILAWTRYAIPSGPLPAADTEVLRVHLGAHVLAADARIMLAPYLFSLEQMPHSFAETFALTKKLGAAALSGTPPALDIVDPRETEPMLADSRFLLAGVAVPRGGPVFRWQEQPETNAGHAGRAQCLQNWTAQGRPNLAPLLPSCGFELLLPDAFYASLHESDHRIRPHTIRASVAYLEGAVAVEAPQLRAVVAGVGEEGIDEYRIGFAVKGNDAVVHGEVWPLYGREDLPADAGSGPDETPVDEISALLKEAGITDIHILPDNHFPEFCDDCGAPLFPDANGDFVHANLPEGGDSAPAHFH